MYTHYSNNSAMQNAFENCCDCLFYGEKMLPSYFCGIPKEREREVYRDAYWWMAEGRRLWLGE